ncbi:MAG TPA: hypothetical protein VGR60_07605 [Gemmatimonadales bacterium]|nr:hypothetical protein [Gemmatimonadales bacterium]
MKPWAPVAAALLLATPLHAQTMRAFEASHRRGDARSLAVRVDFNAGSLHLAAARPGDLYRMRLAFDAERFAPVARYSAADGHLLLGTTPAGETGFRVVGQRQLAQQASVALAPDVPLTLEINIGAGLGDIDLGGLELSSASIRTAASRTTVTVSTPNPGHCSTLDLDAGASELSTDRLGNARCANIRFQGGVGKVTLDLTGAWTDALRVQARMALGELHLLLPKDAGVEIMLDRTLTTFEPVGFTRKGTTYTSANFASARRTIRIDVSTAVGGIVTEWR